MTRLNAWRALEGLLRELWETPELRRWVHFEYSELAGDLPGGNASHSEHVWCLVVLLDRHGLIDAALFERLHRSRPHCREQILAVERTVLAVTQRGRFGLRVRDRRYLGVEGPWRARAAALGYLAGACALLWLIAILYSGGQVAALQKAFFSFLPVKYQRFGFLGATGLALALSGLCRLFARMDRELRS
ncbi:MAG: hypothetical protein R3B09_22745 [Nannocystaceae bacterium]